MLLAGADGRTGLTQAADYATGDDRLDPARCKSSGVNCAIGLARNDSINVSGHSEASLPAG